MANKYDVQKAEILATQQEIKAMRAEILALNQLIKRIDRDILTLRDYQRIHTQPNLGTAIDEFGDRITRMERKMHVYVRNPWNRFLFLLTRK